MSLVDQEQRKLTKNYSDVRFAVEKISSVTEEVPKNFFLSFHYHMMLEKLTN